LIVAVGPVTVIVSLPGPIFVRLALLLELMLPLKACALAGPGATAALAMAIVAQERSRAFRLDLAPTTATRCLVIERSMATGA
jgi:hypothetical protein